MRPALCIVCLLAAPAGPGAQSPLAFTTKDGTRFVVVQSGDAPVMHWIVATDASPLADPLGLTGATLAAIRASLHGTWKLGSRDVAQERGAMRAADEAEAAIVRALLARQEPPADMLRQRDEAAAALQALAEPLRWQRALRAAPSLGTQLRIDGTLALVVVTTDAGGLAEVGRLLVQRRDDAALRGLHGEWRAVRAELQTRFAGPLRALREEVLQLSLGLASEPVSAPLTHEVARELFQRSQGAARTLHVLAGGLPPQRVREVVETVFSGAEPTVATAPAGTARKRGERRSTLSGGDRPALALAWRLEPDLLASVAGREALAVAASWLQSEAGPIAPLLHAAGGGMQCLVTAPFPPGAEAALLLLEVTGTEGGGPLPARLQEEIERAASGRPEPEALRQAAERVQLQALDEGIGAFGAGLRIARYCAGSAITPEQALAAPAAPNPEQVQALLQSVLVPAYRTVVVQESK